MNRYIILLLIFSLSLNALVKIKAKQVEDIIRVKVYVKSPMSGELTREELDRKIKPEFISNLSAQINNQVIYNISMSPFVSKDPIFKFRFSDYTDEDIIHVIATDSNGAIEHGNAVINNKKKDIHYPKVESKLKKVSSQVWKEKDINETIHGLYGTIQTINNKIQFCSENYGINGGNNFSIYVKPQVNLESFSIISDTNERALIAIVDMPNNEIIEHSFKIKVRKKGDILIIGKGRDGKYYKASRSISGVYHSGGDNDGDGDIYCNYK